MPRFFSFYWYLVLVCSSFVVFKDFPLVRPSRWRRNFEWKYCVICQRSDVFSNYFSTIMTGYMRAMPRISLTLECGYILTFSVVAWRQFFWIENSPFYLTEHFRPKQDFSWYRNSRFLLVVYVLADTLKTVRELRRFNYVGVDFPCVVILSESHTRLLETQKTPANDGHNRWQKTPFISQMYVTLYGVTAIG